MLNEFTYYGSCMRKELLEIMKQILAPFLCNLKRHSTNTELDFILCKTSQVDEVISKFPLSFKF